MGLLLLSCNLIKSSLSVTRLINPRQSHKGVKGGRRAIDYPKTHTEGCVSATKDCLNFTYVHMLIYYNLLVGSWRTSQKQPKQWRRAQPVK